MLSFCFHTLDALYPHSWPDSALGSILCQTSPIYVHCLFYEYRCAPKVLSSLILTFSRMPTLVDIHLTRRSTSEILRLLQTRLWPKRKLYLWSLQK